MYRPLFVPIVILASSIAAIAAAAEVDPATRQLQVFPKNIARHHVGTNLFLYKDAKYIPTENAAAWLDDDITSGSAPLTGKQHYLLTLPEAQVVTNFAISAQSVQGTVTIYASDEPAAPGAKSWQPLVREIPLENVNGKKLARPFNRLAKYLLLETNVTEAAPIYSLYVYGELPAVSFQLVKRDTPVDIKAIFGSYVNDLTAISSSGLYAGGRVAYSTEPGNYTAWQKVIDDNPESSTGILSSTDQPGMVLKFQQTQPVTRLSILSGSNAKGKLEVFVVPSLTQSPAVTATQPTDGIQPVSNVKPAANPDVLTEPISLSGLTPSATFTFDGTNVRQSQDLAGVDGSALLFRWTPEIAGEAFRFQELNTFSGYSLSQYTVAASPDAIAELAKDRSKDGKAIADGKDGKAPLEPVGELFPRQTPYSPPSLGFPPPIGTPLTFPDPVSP